MKGLTIFTTTSTRTGKTLVFVNHDYSEHEEKHFDFGVKDAKGRKVGCRVSCWKVVTTPVTGDAAPTSGAVVELEGGRYDCTQYGFELRYTRDGSGYATDFGQTECPDQDTRSRKIEKALQAARMRMQKKFAAA